MHNQRFEGVTETSSDEVHFKWTIKNFSKLSLTEEAYSPVFNVKFCTKSSTWRIALHLNRNDECVHVGVDLVSANFSQTKFCGEIKMLDSKNNEIKISSITERVLSFQGSRVRAGSLIVVERETLLGKITSDDEIVLICDLRILNSKTNLISEPNKLPVSDLESSVTTALDKLRVNEDFSDFTVYVHGKKFHIHKVLLAARSPVFFSMFINGMEEAKSSKVEIEDIEPEVFEEFLKFIYTGKAKIEEYAGELLAAADKYDVQDLKALCEIELFKSINKDNCYKILLLSDRHSANKLKELTIHYICCHSTDGFAEIEDATLLKELIKNLMALKK